MDALTKKRIYQSVLGMVLSTSLMTGCQKKVERTEYPKEYNHFMDYVKNVNGEVYYGKDYVYFIKNHDEWEEYVRVDDGFVSQTYDLESGELIFTASSMYAYSNDLKWYQENVLDHGDFISIVNMEEEMGITYQDWLSYDMLKEMETQYDLCSKITAPKTLSKSN